MTSEDRSPARYLEAAQMLAPRLETWADQIEQERRLPEPVLAALFEAGLFRMLLPRAFDGGEVDPVTFVLVIEEVARADASTAWCLGQAAVCAMVAAYLEPKIAWEVFGRDPRAVLAWGPGPEARATAVDGGYRVRGRWSFASGCRHATWLGGSCPISATEGGPPRRRPDGKLDARTMLFPVAEATIIDVWQVSGLRGTGSDTFTVADLFVPHEHSLARDDPAERRHAGLLYLFPLSSLFASGFAGVALALARRTLDALVGLAQVKIPRGAQSVLRENAVIQSQVGRAEAKLRAARTFLLTTLEETWQAVQGSGALTLPQRMAIRLSATYAIQESKEVVDIAYHAAGASAIFTQGVFERRFRDMHTLTQQLQGRRTHFETVGQFLLGLEADTTFL